MYETTSSLLAWRSKLREPLLELRFAAPQRMLSWAPARPGLVEADTVAWLQVCNADLVEGIDAARFLAERLQDAGLGSAVGLMTSRNVRHHHQATATLGNATASAMVTLGLSNGESIFSPSPETAPAAGTINLVCHVDMPLSESALLEAVSLAATARTAALVSHRYERQPGAGTVVATGTDCIVMACPLAYDAPQVAFAGLHTHAGKAIVRAIFKAVDEACRVWLEQNAAKSPAL